MASNLLLNALIMFGEILVVDVVMMAAVYLKYGRGLMAKVMLWIAITVTLVGMLTFWIGASGVSLWTLGAAIVLAAPIATWVFISVQRYIIRPIRDLTRIAREIALGDLSQQITYQDRDEVGQLAEAMREMTAYQKTLAQYAEEIANNNLRINVVPKSERDGFGLAFMRMIKNLRSQVGQIETSAVKLDEASVVLSAAASHAGQATSRIAATIQQVAQGTAQQDESISKTTASAEQMSQAIEGVARGAQEQSLAVVNASEITSRISSAIQLVAANAQTSATKASQAAETARSGARTVQETIQGMQAIRAKVGLSAEKVEEMGKRSDEIGAIVETIGDIAAQTNLLALNAAIEAARAGEQGKGFAVVADEVRKLAERSSTATKEIGALIKAIQKTVSEAVKAMAEGAKEVELGVARAGESDQALASILKAVEAVNRQVEEIARSAQNISASSNNLVQSMDSVSGVVEENTAATEEMAASSSEVSLAVEMIASVSSENRAAVEQVGQLAGDMGSEMKEVKAAALALADMAKLLDHGFEQFKL